MMFVILAEFSVKQQEKIEISLQGEKVVRSYSKDLILIIYLLLNERIK
jgi:hypothetical protein